MAHALDEQDPPVGDDGDSDQDDMMDADAEQVQIAHTRLCIQTHVCIHKSTPRMRIHSCAHTRTHTHIHTHSYNMYTWIDVYGHAQTRPHTSYDRTIVSVKEGGIAKSLGGSCLH